MKKFPTPALWWAMPLLFALIACGSPTSRDDDGFGDSSDTGFGDSSGMTDREISERAQDLQDLRSQKTRLLVQERMDSALAAYAGGRLNEAEQHLVAALEIDSGNIQALDMLNEVRKAQGRGTDNLTGSSDDARLRLQAQVAKLRAEVESSAQQGFELLDQGRGGEAAAQLRLAQATINSNSYNIDWDGLDERVNEGLVEAQEMQQIEASAALEDERRATFDALQNEERAADEAHQRRIDTMLTDAIESFDAERFDESVAVTNEILRIDPLNEQAVEVRDAAYRARHERVSERFVSDRKERFRSWQLDMDEITVPSSEVFSSPDPDYWARITEMRKTYSDLGMITAEEEENFEIQRQIHITKVPGLRFQGETSLEAVVDQLRTYTDIPFVVTPDAVDSVDSEGIEFNLDLTHELTVANALNVITDAAGADVTFTFKYGVVYITTTTKAQGSVWPVAHDVQDLTAQLVDFSAPKISEIRLPDSTSFGADEEEPAFGGVVGEPVPLMNSDNLENLIRQTIAPTTWDDVDGVSIRYSNGFLIVVHTPEVQEQVQGFLNELRRYISSVVTIEARFLTIQKDYLNEIGVDFRGLGGTFGSLVNLDDVTSGLEDNASGAFDNDGPGLPAGADTNPSAGAFFDEFLDGDIRARNENILQDVGERMTSIGGLTMSFTFLDDLQTAMILRAVEKNNRAQELMSNTISVQNTGRGYVTVLNQVTYVQEMDVEVAQAAIIADPVIGVVSDGIVLDVRPTISHDRKYITLELRPTVATLIRPIQEFTSSLAGLTTPVTLQLPELSVSSANTTVVVPDGGTVVIGGLKKILNVEQRAEIPFLADIPILSLLFKSEQEVNEQQDVIILIRAQITDIREAMARLDAQLGQ